MPEDPHCAESPGALGRLILLRTDPRQDQEGISVGMSHSRFYVPLPLGTGVRGQVLAHGHTLASDQPGTLPQLHPAPAPWLCIQGSLPGRAYPSPLCGLTQEGGWSPTAP